MKFPILSILLGASVCILPQFASATLLVGYNYFGAANDTTPDEGASGFSASMVATGYSNYSSLGSNDAWYGPDQTGNGGVALANGATSNGRADANGAALTITNTNAQSYTLTSLLFDMTSSAEQANTLKFFTNLTYTIQGVGGSIFAATGGTSLQGANPGDALATIDTSTGSGNGFAVANQVSATSRNWSDFIANLTSLTLGPGQQIIFNWSAGSAVRIDNIALTGTLNAIPEPASLLALGCLVGSGAFLRNRRRGPALRMA